MSATRTSLRFKCKTKDCPWRDDEDIHVPWCLGIPDVEHWRDKPTHQHWPKKGMGGNNPKSKIVAILCNYCHDRIDNFDWGNDVKNIPGRGLVYFAWDLHGNTLIEREVMPDAARQPQEVGQREEGREAGRLSDGAEEDAGEVPPVLTEPSAPSLSKEESDGHRRGRARNPEDAPSVEGGGSAATVPTATVVVVGGGHRIDGGPEHPHPLTHKEESNGQESGVPDGGVRGDASGTVADGGGDLLGPLIHEEESDGTESGIVRRSDADMGIPTQVSATPTRRSVLAGVLVADERGDNLPPLTHEQRVAIAQQIHDTEWNRQWFAGDTGNAWIAEMGEEAEQYLSDFGYVHESLANILRVCAAIPKALRSSSLRFSHHVVVADLNREDMDEWLGMCEIEQWSVAEFRRQVKGTKPKVKRWSTEDLHAEVAHYGTEPQKRVIHAFIDFVKERA